MATKKKKQESQVVAIQSQGQGKRPEAVVRDPVTGGLSNKRLEESGLPRNEVSSAVEAERVKQLQAEIVNTLNANPETPQVQEIPQNNTPSLSTQNIPLGGVDPTPPSLNQNTQNLMGTQESDEQLIARTTAILNEKGNPFDFNQAEKLLSPEDFTRRNDILSERLSAKNVLSQVKDPQALLEAGGLALGASGFLEAVTKFSAKAALNTVPEVANYAKYIPKGAGPGSIVKAGQVASNSASRGLFGKLIGAGVTLLSVREMITAVLDDPQSSTAYDRVSNRLSNDIVATQKAFEEETDPLIKLAYGQELDNILEIQKEFQDPDTWEGIKFKVPISKQIAVDNILSRARKDLDNVETRNAQRAIDAYKLIQIKAGQYERLSPDARNYAKRLKAIESENLALAK